MDVNCNEMKMGEKVSLTITDMTGRLHIKCDETVTFLFDTHRLTMHSAKP